MTSDTLYPFLISGDDVGNMDGPALLSPKPRSSRSAHSSHSAISSRSAVSSRSALSSHSKSRRQSARSPSTPVAPVAHGLRDSYFDDSPSNSLNKTLQNEAPPSPPYETDPQEQRYQTQQTPKASFSIISSVINVLKFPVHAVSKPELQWLILAIEGFALWFVFNYFVQYMGGFAPTILAVVVGFILRNVLAAPPS